MGYRNYAIKGSKGKFYESSKEHQDGFNIRYETQQKEIRYHRESDTLEGTLKKITVREAEFNGSKVKYLRIIFDEENGDTGVLSMPVLTQKGALDAWVKAFMLYLPALRKGQQFSVALNKKEKDSKGFLYKTVWFRDENDELIPWAFDPRPAAGIVPKATQTSHPLTGAPVWDFTPVDKFYYDYLMKVVEEWGGIEEDSGSSLGPNESYVGSNKPAPAPAVPPPGQHPQAATGTVPPPPADVAPGYDDLPF